MALTAPELVDLLFGAQWHEAVPILQIGALIGFIYAPFMLCTPLLTAYGAASIQLRINLLFGAALAGCLALGSLHSLAAAAALAVIAHILRMMLLSIATRKLCGISTRSVLKGLRPTACICTVAAACAYATRPKKHRLRAACVTVWELCSCRSVALNWSHSRKTSAGR